MWVCWAALAATGWAQTADVLPQARELAASGKRAEALKLLEGRLAQDAADVDARLLYGTMLSWERRFDESRRELRRVLAGAPEYLDATYALLNVELWSGNPNRAEEIVRAALARHPTDTKLLVAHARALAAEHRGREAVAEARRALAIEPGNQDAQDAIDAAGEWAQPWTAGFDETHEWFSRTYGAWDEYQMTVRRATDAGPVLAHFYRADRLGLHSNQAEVEFYPHFRRGTDAYVEAAYSPDATLYPRYRVGFDVVQAAGRGWELSGGYRRLNFASPVNIVMGSVGKYWGRWLFVGRIYEQPDRAGVSHTEQGMVRRYFGRRESFVAVRVSRGSNLQEVTNVTDLAILRATSGDVELSQAVGRRWRVGARVGMSREDRLNDGTISHYLAQFSVRLLF
jgi:YaiO family outer membrane protein